MCESPFDSQLMQSGANHCTVMSEVSDPQSHLQVAASRQKRWWAEGACGQQGCEEGRSHSAGRTFYLHTGRTNAMYICSGVCILYTSFNIYIYLHIHMIKYTYTHIYIYIHMCMHRNMHPIHTVASANIPYSNIT